MLTLSNVLHLSCVFLGHDSEPYYPVVPAFVGTTSNSDMTGFEASGGCRGKGGWVVFVIFVYASVISCNVYVAQ